MKSEILIEENGFGILDGFCEVSNDVWLAKCIQRVIEMFAWSV